MSPHSAPTRPGVFPPRIFLVDGMPLEHLRIAEGIVTRRPSMISTVLGSCVSVTLFHPQTRTAGIFHAMLPEADRLKGPPKKPCRFVDTALEALFARFSALKVPFTQLEIKLFGGAMSLQTEEKKLLRPIIDVGARNVEAAREGLQQRGLSPSREHVLGSRGRKILFHTVTGEVLVKTLTPTLTDETILDEVKEL